VEVALAYYQAIKDVTYLSDQANKHHALNGGDGV
jgi:hypothetical protein